MEYMYRSESIAISSFGKVPKVLKKGIRAVTQHAL